MKIFGMGSGELTLLFICFGIPLIIAIVCCRVSANLAKKKGYSPTVFGLLGFFLGFIGLIIALAMPSK